MPRRGLAFLLGLVVLILAACGSGPVSGDLRGVALTEPTPKPDFTLTDTNGDPYHFAEKTEGKLTLLYFGYTNCPDICPVHLAQIAETFDQIPQVAGSAEVIFVTVDPERDTPEALRTFLDNFDRRFVGLTGTFEELEEAQKAVGVPVAPAAVAMAPSARMVSRTAGSSAQVASCSRSMPGAYSAASSRAAARVRICAWLRMKTG